MCPIQSTAAFARFDSGLYKHPVDRNSIFATPNTLRVMDKHHAEVGLCSIDSDTGVTAQDLFALLTNFPGF